MFLVTKISRFTVENYKNLVPRFSTKFSAAVRQDMQAYTAQAA